MDNLLKTVVELREELKALKVQQMTQNDSYQYYVYRTQNLYAFNTERQFRIEFIPESRKGDTLCIFRDFDFTFTMSAGQCDSSNPFVYIFTALHYGKILPAFQQQVYVSCISNRKGQLLVTEV